MSDRGNNKTIYAGMKLRTVNRSEYDDNLLRNNQRFNNRLQQEIQAVEKAQRIIAKGLDKETQWFRQKMSTSSLTSTSPRKKNSLADFGAGMSYAGNGYPFPAYDKPATYSGRDSAAARLVPDYQMAGKPGTSLSERPGAATGRYEDTQDGREIKEGKHREGEEGASRSKRTPRTQDDERRHRHHHRHHHRHSSDKKSSRSGKGASDGTAAAADGDAARASTDDVTAEASEGMSGLTLEESQSKSSARSCSSSASSSTRRSSGGSAAASVKNGPVDSATHKSTEARVNLQKGSTSEEGSLSTATTPVSATAARDLNWDGRSRYTNVWHMLSTPKNLSTNRVVRTRLEKELSSRGNEEKRAAAKSKH